MGKYLIQAAGDIKVYSVPLGLISVFLYVGRVQISCGLLPTRFFLNLPIKTITVKKDEISDSLIGKNNYVIRKDVKLPAAP